MLYKSFSDYVAAARAFECEYTLELPPLHGANTVKLLHYTLGLLTESIELSQAMKHNLPINEQLAEIGDICWFSALAAAELQTPPDFDSIAHAPKIGVDHIHAMIEDFGSSVKSAIAYGTPVRKKHSDPHYWKRLPANIFVLAAAIGNPRSPNDCILTDNIRKLEARYGKKFSAEAAIDRDTARESAVINGPRINLGGNMTLAEQMRLLNK